MSKSDLVVKTNHLNTVLQNLTLAEIHIIQLAIVDARETGTGLSTNKPLRISAMRYSEAFNTTRQNAYKRLKEAQETLFNRRFSFLSDKGNKVVSRWVQQVEYINNEGAIEIVFTKAVVDGITRIDGAVDFFTEYLLKQTATMDSNYSVRLYELLVQWKKAKSTPVFDLEKFRGQLGLGVNEYKRMYDFKQRVLDVGVKEINEKSNLKVSYEQKKDGRRIVGFKFKVLEKQENGDRKVDFKQHGELNNGDMFNLNGLSYKQLIRITRHKEFISSYAYLAKGEAGRDWDKFSEFMANEIKKDPGKFSKKRPIKEYLNGKLEDYQY